MLFAVIGLLGGCGGDENDPIDPWVPVSIVGEWQLIRIEHYAPDGTLLEQLRLNADEQDVVIFNEAGFYRYFDCPDGEEYEGTYTYDRLTRRLEMGTSVRRTSVAASYTCNTAADDYSNGLMRWVYEADETGVRKEEFYVPCEQPLPSPPEKEEDMAVYFPDESLRNYMIAHFDTDGDRRITISEAARIETIDLRNITTGDITVTSLEGIEYCTALKYLDCCGSQLPTLDVSRNTRLEKLYCFGNQLTTLDVSQNTALEFLNCFQNQLTNLDVSQNTALTYLSCSNNQLTVLDVSQNTALKTLSCYDNQLTTLDVSQNTQLQTLYCHSNSLIALDVSRNTALEDLYCHGNQLTALDVNRNTALNFLWCFDNQLTILDVSNCKNLQRLVLNPMPSLKTLYMATGQEIPTMNIPNTTQIIHK